MLNLNPTNPSKKDNTDSEYATKVLNGDSGWTIPRPWRWCNQGLREGGSGGTSEELRLSRSVLEQEFFPPCPIYVSDLGQGKTKFE